MKDEFLGTLSHELRTPLNAILGWSQILAKEGREAEDLAEGLNIIERNARAQTRIIEELLEMSRIISGKIRLEVGRVDIASVVRSAVDTVRPAADAKGVEIKMVFDPAARAIMGDASRLQQVFWNLLSNAVKFTPTGGRVLLTVAATGAHVEIAVSDTGEGIAPEFLPQVFDRFSQADASTTRRHGGLGIGLAIVKQLVELHGGTVSAQSPGMGQGSTFTVKLPTAGVTVKDDRDGAPKPDHGPKPIDAATRARIAGKKILVIDDEPDARRMVRHLLEGSGAVVHAAESAAEARELITAESPDLLICDIGMPHEDGYSLIESIRALPHQRGGAVPAVALTAYARGDDRDRALQAGFQRHLVKPVEAAELLGIVASLADHDGS